MQTENSQPARRGFATVFEILTAAAFLAFARAKVDVAIVEVGLGGRLDATNVVLPRLSVIVPVDRDHTRLLGTTPAEIAREKGGIIKHGTPVVVSPQSNEVMAVLEAAAHDKESCLIRSEAVYTIDPVQQSAEEYRFHLRGPARTLANLHIPLVGHHQVSNARTAVVAAEEFLQASGRRLSAREVRDGLGATRWPGRFETVSFGGSDATPVPCILDCAHTPQAGRALRRTLEETQAQPAFVFLLSLSGDKQVSDFLHALLRPGDVVVATRSDSPRAMSPEQICQTAEGVLSGSGLAASHCSHAASDWESGLALAIRLARQTNRPLCVAGSIYLVGLVRSRAEAAHTV